MNAYPLRSRALLASALLLPWVFLGLACGGTGGADVMVMEDDPVLEEAALDEARGIWTSAPFQNARWISLGPGAVVEVPHGLGKMPLSIQVHISGIDDDRDMEAPRAFSAAAGDVANIVQVSAMSVTLKNRTRGQFYVRLTLQ